MKRKILFLIMLLTFIMSCGSKKDSDSSGNDSKDIGKFNYYASVYNDMSEINAGISEYFREAGEAEKIKKSETVKNITVNEGTIEKLQKGISINYKMENLDKVAKELLPVLKELKIVTDDMNNYYSGKDYTSDNFAKAQELHTKFLAIIKKYEKLDNEFGAALVVREKENFESSLNKYKKDNSLIKYNMLVLINESKNFIGEMKTQNLNTANYTQGDLTKLKPIQQKIVETSNNLQKLIKDEKQLKKEKFRAEEFTTFQRSLASYKASVASFISRIERKHPANPGEIKQPWMTESTEGMPNNVLREYGNLVDDYNSIMGKSN